MSKKKRAPIKEEIPFSPYSHSTNYPTRHIPRHISQTPHNCNIIYGRQVVRPLVLHITSVYVYIFSIPFPRLINENPSVLYRSNCSVVTAPFLCRRRHFDTANDILKVTIQRLMSQLRNDGTIVNGKQSGRHRLVRQKVYVRKVSQHSEWEFRGAIAMNLKELISLMRSFFFELYTKLTISIFSQIPMNQDECTLNLYISFFDYTLSHSLYASAKFFQ